MLVLGIDPGSQKTGWALLKSQGNKVTYVSSGVLEFNHKEEFINRLTEIKVKSQKLISELKADHIAFESLIFAKNPNSLIKLAQTRGVILSSVVEKYENRIFEYAPTLIKSTTSGDGKADKESVKKFMDMLLGKREYKTHDESDAVAIALCHILLNGKNLNRIDPSVQKKQSKSKRAGGLQAALAHKIGK